MKTKKILIITGIIVFLGLAAAVSLGTYQLFAVELASRPSVQFLQPLHEQSVSLNGSLVRFIARDKEGIEHVELWVDGELYASKKSELPQGSTPFPLVELWQPDSAGQHVLTARAYNSKNRDTVASVIVQVSDEESVVTELPADLPPGDAGTEVPAPGDGVPPGDAGAEAPAPGDGVPPAAEEEEAEEYIPMLDDSIAIQPLEGFLSEPDTPILDMIPKIRLPGDTIFEYNARLLEVEALYLETDRPYYNGVFCYLSLAGSDKERIPDLERDGVEFIPPAPGNFWDIRSLLAGENSRIVYIDEDTLELEIELQCYGADFETRMTHDLGTLYASHDSSDWDGHLIEQPVIGPDGWFRVEYRINPPDITEGELPAPQLFYYCYESPIDYCSLYWIYPDETREIVDGFIIMINDNPLIYPSGGGYRDGYSLTEVSGSQATCGRTNKYQVIAYQGDPILGEQSLPSYPVFITGDPCYHYVRVHFDYLNPTCLDADIDFLSEQCNFGEMEGDTEFRIDDDAEWESRNGCCFGNFWANDQNIDFGASNYWDCQDFAEDKLYKISDFSYLGVDSDTVLVPLERWDSLTIGMDLWDDDIGDDDRMCRGRYIYYPGEIVEIAKLPDRKKTYTRHFNEYGVGYCRMQYTIEILPAVLPPDFLDNWEDYETPYPAEFIPAD